MIDIDSYTDDRYVWLRYVMNDTCYDLDMLWLRYVWLRYDIYDMLHV